jgi:hypothetical protein
VLAGLALTVDVEIPIVDVDLENMEAPAAGEILTAVELYLDDTMEAPATVRRTWKIMG